MESKRQLKFAKLILEEMVAIFTKEGKTIFGNAFITISDVKMTPDMGLAKIYLSLQFIENKDKLVAALNDNSGFFRGILGKKIKHSVRIIPNLKFYEDNTLDEALKMNQLIDKLNIPSEDPE